MADVQTPDIISGSKEVRFGRTLKEDRMERQRRLEPVEKREEKKQKFEHALDSKKDKKSLEDTPESAVAAINPPSLFDLVGHKNSAETESSIEEIGLTASWQVETSEENLNVPLAVSPYAVLPEIVRAPTETQRPESTQKLFVSLVEEITKALRVEKTSESTKVEITLDHLSSFKGVTLVVTQYAQARKDLNIQFVNVLAEPARQLLQNRMNQQILASALLENGYVVRSITMEPTWKVEQKIASITFEEAPQGGQKDDAKNSSDTEQGWV